jgi:hypothetical protein
MVEKMESDHNLILDQTGCDFMVERIESELVFLPWHERKEPELRLVFQETYLNYVDIEIFLDTGFLLHVRQELLLASLKRSGKRETLSIYILIFLGFFEVFLLGFFSVFPDNFRHLCTTMPWTIWPALVVLWGVCWMFYEPSVGNADAVLGLTEQHYALLPDPGENCLQSCTRSFALTISKRNTGTHTGWQTRAIQFSPTHQTSDNSNTSLPPFTILPYPVQSSTSLVLRM